MGVVVDVSAGWLIRKRPSRETTYCCLLNPPPGASVNENSGAGVPAANAVPAVIDAASSFPLGAMKQSSVPSDRHRG